MIHHRLGFHRSVAISAALMLLPVGAAAETDHPFTGRWRMDTASLKGGMKPSTFRVADGSFSRDEGQPVRADGLFHKVSGSDYVDEKSISIVSDRVVREVDKVHGRLAYTVEYSVSPDGATLTWDVANFTNPNGEPVKSVTTQRRLGAPTAGAHLLTGRWERVSMTVDSKSDWILGFDGRRFSWRTEEGTGYEALVGGRPVRIDGDSAGSLAVITRPRPDTIVETDLSRKGERQTTLRMQLMPDRDTIRGTAYNIPRGTTTTFDLHRVEDR